MSAQPTTIFIDGAYGTTGLELQSQLEVLPQHFKLITIPDAQRKDPSARAAAYTQAKICILCLPDEEAKNAVPVIVRSNPQTKILDASSAHRVHPDWCYGFPELPGQKERIAAAQYVSNPGCYAIAFVALIQPLIANGKLSPNTALTAHGVSGYSGGGKSLIQTFQQPPAASILSAMQRQYLLYSLGSIHKHVPEMQVQTGLHIAPLFQPAVVPCYRGMIVSIPLHANLLAAQKLSPQTIFSTLRNTYANEPAIIVHDQTSLAPTLVMEKFLPFTHSEVQDDSGTHLLELIVTATPDDACMLIARLDNLGKGAAQNAVANLWFMI